MAQITEQEITAARRVWNFDVCRDCIIPRIIAIRDGYVHLHMYFNPIGIIRHQNNILYVNCDEMGTKCINCVNNNQLLLHLYNGEYYIIYGHSIIKVPHSTIALPEEFDFIPDNDLTIIPEIGNALLFMGGMLNDYNNYLFYFDSGIEEIGELLTYQPHTYRLNSGDIVRIIRLQASRKYAAINKHGQLVPVNVLLSDDCIFRTFSFKIQINDDDDEATYTSLNGRFTKPAVRAED